VRVFCILNVNSYFRKWKWLRKQNTTYRDGNETR